MLKRERASFPRRKFRAQWRHWIRSTWQRLLIGSLFFVGPGLFLGLWVDGYLLGFVHASALGLFALAVTCAFFAQTHTVGQMAGAWGEDFTRDELKKARRRRLIWGSVHGVETDSGDIDHLVITRHGGVVAIDSKWRNDPDRVTLARDAAAAAAAARRASFVLRSMHGPTTITPVVAMWGAARRSVPTSARVEGVDFIDGAQLMAWLKALPADPIDRRLARRLLDDLHQFKRRVRPAQRRAVATRPRPTV